MENDRDKESIKDVSTKFLDLIFDSLERLRNREIIMKQGCDSLMQYMREFNFSLSNINYLQVKNMELMITEFEIILPDINSIIDVDKFKKMNKSLDQIKTLIRDGYKSKEGKQLVAFKEIYDERDHKKSMKIYSLFNYLIKELSELRGQLTESLKSILYAQKPKGKESEDI